MNESVIEYQFCHNVLGTRAGRSLKAMRISVFIFLLLVVCSDQNFTDIGLHQLRTETKARSFHPLAGNWALHSILGILGTFLNSFVLYHFVQERHDFLNSINIMIWMDSLYRTVNSAVFVTFKSLMMSTDLSGHLVSHQHCTE